MYIVVYNDKIIRSIHIHLRFSRTSTVQSGGKFKYWLYHFQHLFIVLKEKENSPNCILLYFWYEVHCDEFLWLIIFLGRAMPILTRSPTTCSRKCISRLRLRRVEETGDWNCNRCDEDKRAGRDTIGEKDEKLKKEHNKGKALENLKKRSKEQESNGQHWEKGEKLAK